MIKKSCPYFSLSWPMWARSKCTYDIWKLAQKVMLVTLMRWLEIVSMSPGPCILVSQKFHKPQVIENWEKHLHWIQTANKIFLDFYFALFYTCSMVEITSAWACNVAHHPGKLIKCWNCKEMASAAPSDYQWLICTFQRNVSLTKIVIFWGKK